MADLVWFEVCSASGLAKSTFETIGSLALIQAEPTIIRMKMLLRYWAFIFCNVLIIFYCAGSDIKLSSAELPLFRI